MALSKLAWYFVVLPLFGEELRISGLRVDCTNGHAAARPALQRRQHLSHSPADAAERLAARPAYAEITAAQPAAELLATQATYNEITPANPDAVKGLEAPPAYAEITPAQKEKRQPVWPSRN